MRPVATEIVNTFQKRAPAARATNLHCMKQALVILALAGSLCACSGPGGPATRAGRAVDHAVYHVGTGIEKTGETIENAATGH
jgi:hypothetical protein